MTDLAIFSAFVGGMYDCVAQPWRWSEVLQKLCSHYDSDTSFLAVHDPAAKRSRFNAYAGEPEKVQALVNHHGEKNPFYSILQAFDIDETASLADYCQTLGPDGLEQFRNSQFAKDWAIPYRMGDGMSITLMKQRQRVGTYVMIRSVDYPQFSQAELAALGVLAPHMRRAVTIGDLFEEERRSTAIFREILESLHHAVVVVTADLKILFVNPEAENLLRQASLVRAEGAFVRFASPLVQEAITRAIARGERDEVALGGAGIGVPLSPTRLASVAHVLPIGRRSEVAQFPGQPVAAIFVASQGVSATPAMDAIQALFGLTPAEKRIAGFAVKGLGATEIAASTGVAYTTARAQLDAVFDKTGVSRHGDLVNLLRDLASPLQKNEQDQQILDK